MRTAVARPGPHPGQPDPLPVGERRVLEHPLLAAIEAEARQPADRRTLAHRDAVVAVLGGIGARLRQHGLLRAESRGWRRASAHAAVLTPAILLAARPDLAAGLELVAVEGFGISSRPAMPRRYRYPNWSGPPPAGNFGPTTRGGPTL